MLEKLTEKEFWSRNRTITFQGHELQPDEAASAKGILPMIYYRMGAVANMAEFSHINDDFAIEPLNPKSDDDHENMTLTGYALVQKKPDDKIDRELHALFIVDIVRETERMSLELGHNTIEVSMLAEPYTPPFVKNMALFNGETQDLGARPTT